MTGPRGPLAAGADPAEKPRSFGPSIKRLIGLLAHYRIAMIVVLASIVGSVVATSIAPRILGHATDLIFNGIIGSRLPAGISKEQAVAGLRGRGQGTFADMVASMNLTPGVGVDFSAVARVLTVVLALYVGASLVSWLASYLLNIVVVGTITRLRADVEVKVHRLPAVLRRRPAR